MPAITPSITHDPHVTGMLMGAFVGDALALSAHWIYDPSQITTKVGRVTQLSDPLSPYHQGKKAGDYTHIGDQMWILHESLCNSGGFDALDFSQRWRAFWKASTTIAYRDSATKQTMEALERGAAIQDAGSPSEELAGASRGIPLIAAGLGIGAPKLSVLESACQQTALTHRGLGAVQASAFLTHLFFGLAEKLCLSEALENALTASSPMIQNLGSKARFPALQSLSTTDAIAQLGQACDLSQAFPSTLLLLSRHADSYEEAMIANVMAGGDSASRGIILGAVLGYIHGVEAIPKTWRENLHKPPN